MASNWRSTDWNLDITDIDDLIEKIEKIPNRSEQVINKTLKKKSAPKAVESIQTDIPISSWKGKVLNKKHAHDSNALTVKNGNLEFTIRPKPRFNYIKYPDLGIGTSQHNEPKRFMRKGLNQISPEIIKDLTDAVVDEINKTLGE